MKNLVLVAIAAMIVVALIVYRLRSLKRFHPNAELLIGILNQLR